MAFAQDENRLSPYRKFLVDLSSHLSGRDLETLKFAALEFIPRRITENISSGLKFFDVLEQDGRITPRDLSLLVDMFKTIGRMDLAWKIQCFSTSPPNNDINGIQTQVVTDGDGNATTESSLAVPGNTDNNTVNRGYGDIYHEDVVCTDGVGNESESDPTSASRSRSVIDHTDKGYGDTYHEDVVTDGVGNESESDPTSAARSRSVIDHTDKGIQTRKNTDGDGNATTKSSLAVPGNTDNNTSLNTGSSSDARGPALSSAPGIAPAPCSQAQEGQQSRLQHDSSFGPTPAHYVNFLALQGYSVEIFGGKHFKTPEGEFVEIKSGTQYKIHVKNSRAYGCNLDISIDGYDVGGWVVNGGQELTIERPACKAKKFTFYRVKTAPKEAGIESGRSENGVVKCVFTPEALLNIPVVISRSSQPVEVNMAPNATVGDLKCELQSQLNTTQDPDQILVLNDKVLSNVTRLSSVTKSPGNLRLIDIELEVTVEAASNETFPVKIQPHKAKVFDLMNLIQRKLDVAIKDQKLYYGKDRISDAPERALPPKLVCSVKPTVVLIVPEYILVTIEDLRSGDSRIVKINKEETLRDLVKEIPLLENEEAMFYFNEKELCPSRDDGTLTSLGISSGSKLKLKVKIVYIEINVAGFPGSSPTLSIGIRCNPRETFKDLLSKLEAKAIGNTKMLEGATFATGKKVFDPEQDMGSLHDYGIEHGSTLVMKVAGPELEEDSRRVKGKIAATRNGKKAKKKKSFLKKIFWRKKRDDDDNDDDKGDDCPKVRGRHLTSLSFEESLNASKVRGRQSPNPYLRPLSFEAAVGGRDYDDNDDDKGDYLAAPNELFCEDDDDNDDDKGDDCPKVRGRHLRPLSFEAAVGGRDDDDNDDDKGDYLAQSPYHSGPPNIESRVKKYCLDSASIGKASRRNLGYPMHEQGGHARILNENDPAWKAGGTTLQGHSTQQFMPADPIKVDHSKKIELVLRLVAREDETDLVFPKDKFQPLSTLYPPAVPE